MRRWPGLIPLLLMAGPLGACVANPGSSTETPADRCVQARDAYADAQRAADGAVADLEALRETGAVTLSGTPTEYELLFVDPTGWTETRIASSGSRSDDGDPMSAWDTAQEEGIGQLRLASRLVTGDPDCWDPAEVAAAEEFLAQTD